ncbi:MAG: TolC family protein [Chitinophagales bacterium]
MKKVFFAKTILFFLTTTLLCYAQTDSALLSQEAYLAQVLAQHPVAKQANLQQDFASATMLDAKGKFDPKLSASWKDKFLSDKHYYRHFSTKLLIPTQYGLQVSANYENNSGYYLNPENKTDKYGLWAVGIEANILQGFFIDERRAAIQQARIYEKITKNERQMMLNNLALMASLAYIEWQKNYYTQQILAEAMQIAQNYRQATTQSFLGGEKTAIDTLEAFLMVQDRMLMMQENEMLLENTKQQLENYLWQNNQPIALNNTTIPEIIETENLLSSATLEVREVVNTHPQILEKNYKRAYYEVELRAKKDKLKPKLKLKYVPLLKTAENSIAPNYALANYKWGFEFAMPLLFRSERASVQKSQLKIKNVDWSVADKRNELQNKIEASLQQQQFLQQQIALQQQNLEGYKKLLDAENTKFEYGESSVFLVNKRQEKYIDAKIKLISWKIKYKKEYSKYLYFTNDIL